MKKQTFEDIIGEIFWRLSGEKLETNKRYSPLSFKHGGIPDFEIWTMLKNKAYRTRLSNRVSKALKDKYGWNTEVEIIYGGNRAYPEDEQVYVTFIGE